MDEMKKLVIGSDEFEIVDYAARTRLDGHDKLLNYVTPEMFGAVGDGVADDTTAIQTAVNSAESSVLFSNKVYKISSTIELKTGIKYNFNGARIVFSGTNAIHGTGSKILETTLSANYAANDNYFELTSVSGVSEGDVITVVNTTELAHTSRTYYYKGATFEVKSIDGNKVYINGHLPYDMSSTGATVEVYTPITCEICNIGGVSYSGSSLSQSTYALFVEHGLNCIISGYNAENELGGQVMVFRCVNTVIDSVTGNIPRTTELVNPYVIGVLSSTNTLITNSFITSFWHAISTGYQESCLNTTVRDCVLFNSGEMYAYGDHENAINTKIIDSVCEGILIGQSGDIIRCISRMKALENANDIAPISLSGATTYDYSDYTIDDCLLIGDSAYAGTYNGITFRTLYYNKVVVRNCKSSQYSNINVPSSSYTNKVIVENCENILPYMSTGGTVQYLLFQRCKFVNPVVFYNNRVILTVIKDCEFVLTADATINFAMNNGADKTSKIYNTTFKSSSTTKHVNFTLTGKILLEDVICENADATKWILKNTSYVTMRNAYFPCSTFSSAAELNGTYVNPDNDILYNYLTQGGTKYRGLLNTTDLVIKYEAI